MFDFLLNDVLCQILTLVFAVWTFFWLLTLGSGVLEPGDRWFTKAWVVATGLWFAIKLYWYTLTISQAIAISMYITIVVGIVVLLVRRFSVAPGR